MTNPRRTAAFPFLAALALGLATPATGAPRAAAAGALSPALRTAHASAPPAALRAGKKPAAPIEIVLQPYVGLLRTVPGKAGDLEGPFLFDTGGGATFLSTEAAKSLQLTPFGRVTGFRHDGGRIDVPRAGPVDLRLGGFTHHGEVGVLDFGALLGNLPPVSGLVALETFEGQAITIDLAHNRLIVESEASLAKRVRKARELQVRFERQGGGATLDLHVAVQGKHGPLWFELDAGALSPVLVAPHAFAELGIEPPAEGTTKKADLQIAGLGAVSCEISAKEMIYDGLLNAELFTRYVFTLDLKNARAWAVPNP